MDLATFTPATWVGVALTVLVSLGIIFVGLAYLIAPASMSGNFGFRGPSTPDAVPWQHIKGPRDIASGLVPLAILVAFGPGAAALVIVIETLIPLGDAFAILRHRGRLATALGVHVLTAVVMIIAAVLLLV